MPYSRRTLLVIALSWMATQAKAGTDDFNWSGF